MHPETGGELLLRPSKWKWFGVLLISLMFVAIGTWAVRKERAGEGWFVLLFFGLCAAVCVIQLLPGASYLRCQREGFVFCSLFRKSPSYKWTDVSPFHVAQVGRRSMVVFDREIADSTLVRMNRSLTGASDGLPDSFGMSPEALAELLNTWRARALAHS